MNVLRTFVFCTLVFISMSTLIGGNTVADVDKLLSSRSTDPVLTRALQVASNEFSKLQMNQALEDPFEIATQVVSGINYTFKYNVGNKIWKCVVYCQPWTQTYEVLSSNFE